MEPLALAHTIRMLEIAVLALPVLVVMGPALALAALAIISR